MTSPVAKTYIGQPGAWVEVPWSSFTWLDSAGIINDTFSFKTQGNLVLPEPGFIRLVLADQNDTIDHAFSLRSYNEDEISPSFSEYTLTGNRIVNTSTTLATIGLTLAAQLVDLIPPAHTIGSIGIEFELYSLPIQIARLAGEAVGRPDDYLLSTAMFEYLLGQITDQQLTWPQFRDIIEKAGFEVYFDGADPKLFDPYAWQQNGYPNVTQIPYLTKKKIIENYSRREGPWNIFYGLTEISLTDGTSGDIDRIVGTIPPSARFTADRIHDTRFVKIFEQTFDSWEAREIAIRRETAEKRARTLAYEFTTLPDLNIKPRDVYFVGPDQVRVETVTRRLSQQGYTTTVKAWDLIGNL